MALAGFAILWLVAVPAPRAGAAQEPTPPAAAKLEEAPAAESAAAP